jgi:hypothetical protein
MIAEPGGRRRKGQIMAAKTLAERIADARAKHPRLSFEDPASYSLIRFEDTGNEMFLAAAEHARFLAAREQRLAQHEHKPALRLVQADHDHDD